MKRKSFLRAFGAIGAAVAFPFSLVAKTASHLREGKGFFVKSGLDRFNQPQLLFGSDKFMTKVSTADTDGDLYVFESTRLTEGGPVHHYHFAQDEWWYVLEGEFLIKVGETTYPAKAGDAVFGPRMVPHSFAKIGQGVGRLLMIFQPAGKMEECFKKISQGLTRNMTEAEQDKFREEHGFKRVGPPVGQFKAMSDK